MKTRITNRCIRITSFTHKGDRLGKFESIQCFLNHAKAPKLHSRQLGDLRFGRLVLHGKYLIGLSKKFTDNSVSPLSCKALVKKRNAAKHRNIIKLRQFYAAQQLIVVVGGYLEILGYSWGTINKLAKREGVSVGTIKSSLHRSAKRFSNSQNPHTKHYVWMTDLPAFISHVEKFLCSK